MPAYDATAYRPPAPVAIVTVLSPATGLVVSNVPMLVDTGADVSLLPRGPIESLVGSIEEPSRYELEGFDGKRSLAPVANLEIRFLGKSFRGQFLLLDAPHGVLGRNILNSLTLLFDGPNLIWTEQR